MIKSITSEERQKEKYIFYNVFNKILAQRGSNRLITKVSFSDLKDLDFDIKVSTNMINAVDSVRCGVNFKDFKNLLDLIQLPNSKWAEIIGVSERTMQSILKEKRNLDQNKSEKLVAFLMLVENAIDVLGDQNNLIEWLHYKSSALNGKTPLDYVDTFQGINMLREQLFKIETGNLA